MRAVALLLGLTACAGDETISGFVDPLTEWQLTELNGAPFEARATIAFPEEGRVEGRGPCNRFFGEQRVPYPWIEIGPLASTKLACPDLTLEQQYLEALQSMSLAEVNGAVLILSSDTGEMIFEALPAE